MAEESVGCTFQVGDRVCWTSQSGGHTTEKRGVVVGILPARAYPERHIPEGYTLDDPGMWRGHTSYFVAVGRQLYWPRVKHLRKEPADA